MALNWMRKAKCQGLPLNYFFDDYVRSKEVYDEVNKVCGQCEVKKQCLNYGKSTKSLGVWGGNWLLYGVKVETLTDLEEDNE